MTGEEAGFRLVLGVLLSVGLGIRWYFKRKAPADSVATRQAAREKLAYQVVLGSYLVMFVYVLSPVLDFAHFSLATALRWLGAGLMLAAGGLLWWTHRTLGRNWSGVLEIRRDHRLVSEGPYARIRHPMYTAFFMTGLGALALSANWLLGLVNLGAVTWMYLGRIEAEEDMMLTQFGDEYRAYMTRTGRLLPRRRVPESRGGPTSGHS